jgi:hypothetical protein
MKIGLTWIGKYQDAAAIPATIAGIESMKIKLSAALTGMASIVNPATTIYSQVVKSVVRRSIGMTFIAYQGHVMTTYASTA